MRKKFIFGLCFLLSFIIILNSCGEGKKSPALKDKGLLNVCLGTSAYRLDPAYASGTPEGSLIMHLFEGLYVLGEGQEPILAQATSCKIDEEGLVYIFTLKDGLKWSNGEALLASDFVYSWNRAALIEGSEGRSDLFDVIARNEKGELHLESPDDKTLIVNLKSHTPYFTELLALPQFCPVYKKMINYNPERWSENPDSCVGNGAYKLSEIARDSHVAIEKNEFYHQADEVKTEKINFISMNRGTAYGSFMEGDILFADRISTAKISEAAKRDDYFKKTSYGTYYLYFNPKVEPFKDINVRRALMLAIDRSYITKEIGMGANKPAGALVPPGMMLDSSKQDFRSRHDEAFDPKTHDENLELAKLMLTEAGYSEEGKTFPTIRYQYNSSSEHSVIAKAIQTMWAELGITLQLDEMEWDVSIERAKSGDFQIMRSGWMCDWSEPDAILNNFKTGNVFNISGFSNEEYDSLLDSAALETDPEKRSGLFYQAESTLLDQWTVCPLFYYSDLYMQSEYLTGVKISPLGYKSFVNAEIGA